MRRRDLLECTWKEGAGKEGRNAVADSGDGNGQGRDDFESWARRIRRDIALWGKLNGRRLDGSS